MNFKDTIKRIVPRQILDIVLPPYHYLLALLAALWYRFPSRHLTIIAVTGTKGKSSTIEILNAILEEAGYLTALAGTIRFKIGNNSRPNLFKMTMPGRFFIQKFLRDAVRAQATHAILEITSEGVVQSRHRFIDLDALIFTNIAPEHIEAHGSFERYLAAKLALVRALERSRKRPRIVVANADDPRGRFFLEAAVEGIVPFSLADAAPYTATPRGINMTFRGKLLTSSLPGEFNVYNLLAAILCAEALGVSADAAARGLSALPVIHGRAERIEAGLPAQAGQSFTVVVDYAHTPGSLTALYNTYRGSRLICVLGNTGGGRDRWKRPDMGKIADNYCTHVILTDEDPYDESPRGIVKEMAAPMKRRPLVIMDRRRAIRRAFSLAAEGDVVLITGKGTDPYIMGPRGAKEPWSDAAVAREELVRLIEKRAPKTKIRTKEVIQ